MEYYDDPMILFRDALPNKVTRQKYERRLAQFFDYLKLDGDIDTRAKQFVQSSQKDPKWTVSMIMKYVRYQKERVEKKEISVATLPNYHKPIKLFCVMNDLDLNWKKITRTLPKGKAKASDRIPTITEIKQLIKYPDRRLRPAILTMMSSGIRLGAWDYLRWGDVTSIRSGDKVIAGKIVVYRGEPEEYVTFITSEAFEALDDYMGFRKSHGEDISPKSWLLRDNFDLSGKNSASLPRRLKSSGFKSLVERALWGQGLRKPLEEGKKRHEFQTDHGFRKFFKTMAERKMKTLHVEMLMGHATGLSDNYYRISEDDLQNDYLNAIPDLSINENSMERDERIKNLENEFMKMKLDLAYLLQTIGKNGKINPQILEKEFPAIDKHVKFGKGDFMYIKDTDGSEIVM